MDVSSEMIHTLLPGAGNLFRANSHNAPALLADRSTGPPAFRLYCTAERGVETRRVTLIAGRSRYSGTRGAILVFQ